MIGSAPLARAALLLAVLTSVPILLQAQAAPRLERTSACPMELAEDVRAGLECGWLVVPEDYERPGSRSVRLAWALARATGAQTEPDPVIQIFGGPGSPALDRASEVLGRASWQRVRRQRDLLFLDLRGTGYSDPTVCPSIDEVVAEHDILVSMDEALDTLLLRAVDQCADPTTNGGYDPAAYNSPSAARDLDELRELLGYERWNVYGVSYGGRIAQALMRDRPGPIRAVVLDAPVALGEPWSRSLALSEALSEFFRQCRVSPECDGAYPNLESRFEQLLGRLETSPVTVRVGAGVPLPDGRFVVTREQLVRFVHGALFQGVTPPLLPALIWEASEGSDDALLGFLPEMLRGAYQSGLAEGLALAVVCYDAAMTTPEFLRRVRTQVGLLSLGGWWDARVHPLCDRLHSARATESEFNPVDTGLPTLVLGGGHDPAVAPSSIRHAASVESGATLVMAMAAGHGIERLPCGGTLVASFIEEPSAVLDLACLEAHQAIPFVTDIRPIAGMARFSTNVLLRYPGGRATVGFVAFQLWLLVSVFILLLAPVIWGVMGLRRRTRIRTEPFSDSESRALWLAAATCGVGVTWVFFFQRAVNRTWAVSERLLAVGVLDDAGWALLLPWPLTVLSAVLVGLAGIAWRRGWWGHWMRVHYGLVACGATGLASFAWYWGLV